MSAAKKDRAAASDVRRSRDDDDKEERTTRVLRPFIIVSHYSLTGETTMHHRTLHDNTSTIEHIVLKPPRARLIESRGEGFGSYVERLVNVAYETHQAFADLLRTLNDFVAYLQRELDRTYPQQQFTIVVGKQFQFDSIDSTLFAHLEHGGWKVLIFSSIGCSYRRTTTLDDEQEELVW